MQCLRLLCLVFSLAAAPVLRAAETLLFDQPQLAGLSGFRAFWDTPVVLGSEGLIATTEHDPGGTGPNAVWAPAKRAGGAQPDAIVFDAVHRSVLVRFPGSARLIADELRKGFAITKVELILPHRATELWAEGYAEPPGMSFLGNLWAERKPRWHAVAWALRQPWVADRERRPTFNASVNGFAYWKQFGAAEFKEFDAFQKHIADTRVETRWDAGEKTVHATLIPGADTLEAGFKPGYTGNWDQKTPTDQCFPYRRVNGAWPYPAKVIERNGTLSQISRTGHAAKGGATLTVEPGRMACVEFEPVSGTWVGFTPLPDATTWKLELPGGIVLESDGQVGMLRATAHLAAKRLSIEHAPRPGESTAGMATTLRLTGLSGAEVQVNGRPAARSADGRIPLGTP